MQEEDGGEHACSAGGYTVGNGEGSNPDNASTMSLGGVNGSGGRGGAWNKGTGGGYYSKGSTESGFQAWFSQGGIWKRDSDWQAHVLDYAGSGGESGAGGTVYYTSISKIHAYNGNRITEENFDYNVDYYGYDNGGNLLTSGTPLEVVTRKDGKKIIPAYIFAQAGTIRAVYKTNQRMTEEECATYNVDFINSSSKVNYTKVTNVEILPETSTTPTSYGQGIGSGAGNLEKSNGIFEPLSN